MKSSIRTMYLELRKIGKIRHHTNTDCATLLVSSLVLSKLDYCNSLLAGLPTDQIHVHHHLPHDHVLGLLQTSAIMASQSSLSSVIIMNSVLQILSLYKVIQTVCVFCGVSSSASSPFYFAFLTHQLFNNYCLFPSVPRLKGHR